jgi:hypothetical protein
VNTVVKGVLIALAVTAAMPTPPAIGQPQQIDPAPQLQEAQELGPEAQKRRNKIQLMEGLLARAGSIAAESFGRQLQQIEPSMTVALMGQSRARGFMLDGYGVFFDVEVPELRATVVIAQLMLQRDMEIANALSRLKRALHDMPEGPNREQAQQAIRVLDIQAGTAPQERRSGQAFSGNRSQQNPAIQVNEGAVQAADAPALPPSGMPGETVMAVMKDPRKEYRDTVQRELIDAMLDYSVPLDIGPDEWLAVAARVAEPGQRGQTLMLRVKGSDLAVFAADKDRRAEIRGRVEVRVF